MKSVKDFLKKDFLYTNETKKEYIILCVKNHTGATLVGDQISFSGSTIFISIRPNIKSSILEKKSEILLDIQKEHPFFDTLV